MSERSPKTNEAVDIVTDLRGLRDDEIDWSGLRDVYGSDQVEAIKLYRKSGPAAFRHAHSAEGFPVTASELPDAHLPESYESAE